jgi:acyl carrier protein
MSKAEFLTKLDEMLALTPGTLKGPEKLKELPEWDSLAVMFFISLVDEKFSTVLNAEKVAACRTIDDLVALCGSAVN